VSLVSPWPWQSSAKQSDWAKYWGKKDVCCDNGVICLRAYVHRDFLITLYIIFFLCRTYRRVPRVARWNHNTSRHPSPLKSFLILSSHLRLCIPCCLSPTYFNIKTAQAFIFVCCLSFVVMLDIFCTNMLRYNGYLSFVVLLDIFCTNMLRYNGYLSFVALSDTIFIYVSFMIKQYICKVLGYRHVHSSNST
jgi:hypothetical protein